MMDSFTTSVVTVHRAAGAGASTLAQDVREGLAQTLKQLPPKHLYDERGSLLFDQICDLPEYYPTRTERAILAASADAIATATGARELVELGAGTAAKTRLLLDALARAGTLRSYLPFDIDESMVRSTACAVAAEYPELASVDGVAGDFEHDLGLIPAPTPGTPRIVALLGGTIGNFVNPGRRRLLGSIATLLGAEDHLLLGVDLVKDPQVIEAAYNDSAGITAQFNLNMLNVINRELDADFPLDRFEHVAFYDPDHEWIEMRLRAIAPSQVRIAALDLQLEFETGEEIRTEISAKFTRERLAADLGAHGLRTVELFTDPDQLFALVLARPQDRPSAVHD